MNREAPGCPHVVTSGEGTAYCALAEQAGRERDAAVEQLRQVRAFIAAPDHIGPEGLDQLRGLVLFPPPGSGAGEPT